MAAERRVCVVGLGYIGLPTAAVLAHRGWQVAGVDTNDEIVEGINRGRAHIVEPDIDTMVRSAVESQRLRAYRAPQPSDVFMICVPTPFQRGTEPPQPDLDHVFSAARAIGRVLEPGNLVIIESTCPVGTTERLLALLADVARSVDGVRLAYCPERVLPGRIFVELVSNDRIVGGIDEASAEAAEHFYRTFVEGGILSTDSRTAEMVKLVENSFRDVNIAFANEISMLCDRLGIDPWELIRLANRHPRVNILQPGPGVGGHCIAVDPWFIVAEDREHARLIRIARNVNDSKTGWVVEKIRIAADSLGVQDRPVRIACFGLAYKPDIGDLRESPAMRVAQELAGDGYEVLAVEPNLDRHDDLPLHSARDAVERADLVALLVAHSPFLGFDFGETPVMDFCGALLGNATRAKSRSTGHRAATVA